MDVACAGARRMGSVGIGTETTLAMTEFVLENLEVFLCILLTLSLSRPSQKVIMSH